MKKLASILCDGGEDRKDYRRNIYLIKGRLICDKNDITPMPGKYPRTQAGTNQALDDIEAMYSAGVWELEFHEFTKPVLEKYSKEWKIAQGKWIQKHRDATKGDIWKIHYIANDTEYSAGEFFSAAAARAELKNYGG